MRIPVEKTIGDTYKFTFSNMLSIFGITWFPIAIMVLVIGGAVWMILPDLQALDWSANPNAAHNQAIALGLLTKVSVMVLPIEILFYLLFAMVQVGLQRKALGLMEGPVFVYFSLGGAVWRLLGGIIVGVILVVLGAGLTFAAVSAVYWLGEHYALPGIYGLAEFAATVAGICWFLYMAVRLLFFIPPVVVAEGGFGIARSWQLGAGNFWRIVIAFIAAVVGPSIVISIISEMIIIPFMGPAMMKMQQAALENRVVPPQEIWATIGPVLHIVVPVYIGIQLIAMPVVFGLSAAVSAFSYRNITRSEIPA